MVGSGSEIYRRAAELLSSIGRMAKRSGAEIAAFPAVYLGDSGRDVEAARIAGAHSIAVASGRSGAGELLRAGAHIVVDDLSDTDAVVRAVYRLTSALAPGSLPWRGRPGHRPPSPRNPREQS